MSEAESQKEIDRICKLAQSTPSMFQILDLDFNTATVKLVKSQYNKLVLLTHPDKVKLPKASDAFALVNRAYKILNNEVMLERTKQGEAKKQANAVIGAAAAAMKSEEKKELEADQMAKDQEKLHEEFLAAVRARQEAKKNREREAGELAEHEQQKSDILAAAEAWKKAKPGGAGGAKKY